MLDRHTWLKVIYHLNVTSWVWEWFSVWPKVTSESILQWDWNFPYTWFSFNCHVLCLSHHNMHISVISVSARHSGCSLQHHDGELWQWHFWYSGVRCLGKQKSRRFWIHVCDVLCRQVFFKLQSFLVPVYVLNQRVNIPFLSVLDRTVRPQSVIRLINKHYYDF